MFTNIKYYCKRLAKILIQGRVQFLQLMFFELLVFGVMFGPSKMHEAFMVLVFLGPVLFLLNIRILLSKNILFMAYYTFFSIPACIAYFIAASFKIHMITMLVITFIVCLLYFYVLLLKYKLDEAFLDNVKISLDLVRLFFILVLAWVGIYANLSSTLGDFSGFLNVFASYKALSFADVKSKFLINFQAMSLPFIVSASLIRILVDVILLIKKHHKNKIYFIALQSLVFIKKQK
ncbi:hypothetical protein B5M42_002260 [Paenibacillus athensensis]|uniref:Uncharacterized protein n=1 Tax=Paenibacillus athensensis TaxID=1967502 RepID=A0A4Y8QAH2_9BACL|nr:hypothetical protein [Paenibacillus athensensis]MCD1257662.1 hypothetical protein [Paenibacillus athensensis]